MTAEITMNEFGTFDVVHAEIPSLLSLFALRSVGSTSIAVRSIRVSEVASFEEVASYEYAGSPHARLTLRSGEVVYVKQHVTTVAKRLGRGVNPSS